MKRLENIEGVLPVEGRLMVIFGNFFGAPIKKGCFLCLFGNVKKIVDG
jgi:hypothetical protein